MTKVNKSETIETTKVDTKKKTIKKLVGLVVSDKMNKTVVVKITRKRAHPMYGKIFEVSRKIQAHDEKDEYKNGDMVEISETRPYSKNKSWQVIRKVK